MNAVLQNLADSGIVVRGSSPANLYRLNKDHVAAEGILALAGMWATLLSRIRAELANWSMPPEAASLFGSAARREAKADSDIDILIVAPPGVLHGEETFHVWQLQTDALAENIRAWTATRARCLRWTPQSSMPRSSVTTAWYAIFATKQLS